jgi:hypothetical protein
MASVQVNPPADAEQFLPTSFEVDRGLGFLLRSYILLCLLLGLGLVCAWALTDTGREVVHERLADYATDFQHGLYGAVCLIGGITYLLLLLGQWWCLSGASSCQNAKETMFVCVIAFLISTLFHVASIWVGGVQAYFEWEHSLRHLNQHLVANPAFTLKLIGAVVLLFWFCCLNHFLRLVAGYLRHQEAGRKVDLYLVYMCGLFGVTFGLMAFADQLLPRVFLLGCLIFGWIMGLGGHLWRLLTVRAAIRDSVMHWRWKQANLSSCVTLESTPKRLSGLRRVLKNLNNQ